MHTIIEVNGSQPRSGKQIVKAICDSIEDLKDLRLGEEADAGSEAYIAGLNPEQGLTYILLPTGEWIPQPKTSSGGSSGGGEYTLPMASSGLLGGVRAKEIASANTMEVMIDRNTGYLYTTGVDTMSISDLDAILI